MANANKNLANQMSQEMIDNIKNYADKIETLEDFITAVRKRPGTWLTGVGDPGFIGMIREIFQNALDELKFLQAFIIKECDIEFEDNRCELPWGFQGAISVLIDGRKISLKNSEDY